MLIFGFGVKEILLATIVYICETCGNSAAHQLIRRVRTFSLFFVPLFGVSTRYLDTCTACGRTVETTREQAVTAVRTAGPGLR